MYVYAYVCMCVSTCPCLSVPIVCVCSCAYAGTWLFPLCCEDARCISRTQVHGKTCNRPGHLCSAWPDILAPLSPSQRRQQWLARLFRVAKWDTLTEQLIAIGSCAFKHADLLVVRARFSPLTSVSWLPWMMLFVRGLTCPTLPTSRQSFTSPTLMVLSGPVPTGSLWHMQPPGLSFVHRPSACCIAQSATSQPPPCLPQRPLVSFWVLQK